VQILLVDLPVVNCHQVIVAECEVGSEIHRTASACCNEVDFVGE
jgi:hypothetical protein